MAEEKTSIEHTLVPKYAICSDDEIKELLSKYNIQKDRIPKISFKDPSIINEELEPGTVLKISRKSKTEPNSFFYRVVI
jgi:DNA-directed RNA polymerase subunit H